MKRLAEHIEQARAEAVTAAEVFLHRMQGKLPLTASSHDVHCAVAASLYDAQNLMTALAKLLLCCSGVLNGAQLALALTAKPSEAQATRSEP